jgi:branched-chain amino acid aminotransferase
MRKMKTWKIDHQRNAYEQIELAKTCHSLDEVSKTIPQGAYTTFRTFYHNKIFHIQDHFSRLEESARLAKCRIKISQELLRQTLRHAIWEEEKVDLRVRITLDLEINQGDLYITVEKLKIPSTDSYENGVCAITLNLQRENPKAKLTSFIGTSDKYKKKLNDGVTKR